MDLIIKAKSAMQGETRIWADGKTRKKIGKKWIVVDGGTKTEKRIIADAWRRGQMFYDYSMTTNLGDIIDSVLQRRGISNYNDLVEAIKRGPQDTAHRIYKEAIDQIRKTLAPVGDKKAASDLLGKTLIILKETFSSKPKSRLTITKTSRKGKEYRTYAEGKHTTELPPIKASRIKTERKKMGGWSITGPLTTQHIRGMLANQGAKVISGQIDARKKWVLPVKAEDMELKYRGDSLTIQVKQIVKKKERTRATAKVEIKIPYAFAKAFLLNQIKSIRTRNTFIFKLEHSQGYRDYLGRYGA